MLSNPQNESKPTHKSRSQSLEVYLTVGEKKKKKQTNPKNFMPSLICQAFTNGRGRRGGLGWVTPSLL